MNNENIENNRREQWYDINADPENRSSCKKFISLRKMRRDKYFSRP